MDDNVHLILLKRKMLPSCSLAVPVELKKAVCDYADGSVDDRNGKKYAIKAQCVVSRCGIKVTFVGTENPLLQPSSGPTSLFLCRRLDHFQSPLVHGKFHVDVFAAQILRILCVCGRRVGEVV